jgi:aspartate/methionine/tyrosine aminotransferase
MFSSRIPWTLGTNALTQRIEARRAAGARLLDLTVSNPTDAGLQYPADEIRAALAQEGALHYEPTPQGLAVARAAVAGYYAEALSTTVTPEQVLLTASTSEAYAYLFKLLADPGDRVLIPHPSYPLFDLLAALESVHLDPYPLRYDGSWSIDLDALARAITPRTRAILLVHPNNPTGSFLSQHELQALRALCRTHDLALVSDEVFADYPFAADPERVPTVAGVDDVLVFALSGLSKVCALPQLKLGWIVTGGPPALRAAAAERLELIADTFLSVGAPVQHAAPTLLALRHGVQQQIRARTQRNRTMALRALAESPEAGCSALHAEGGWYLVLRVPHTQSEEAWVLELLERDDLLVHPGYFFDFGREAFVVLSLLTPEEVFREGITRLLARARAHLAHE